MSCQRTEKCNSAELYVNSLPSLVLIVALLISFQRICYAGEILPKPLLSYSGSSIGDKIGVQLNISLQTNCDNFTVGKTVNYFTKKIVISVNYNHFPDCTPSSLIVPSFNETQLVLEGSYDIAVELSVPGFSQLNKTYQLGSPQILPPQNTPCIGSTNPVLEENCPTLSQKVCACNGVTYQNECYAYLEERNGKYIVEPCPYWVNVYKLNFTCNSFTSFSQINFLDTYSCDAGVYEGNEIIWEYIQPFKDSFHINFTTQATDVRLFLIKVVGSNLQCLAISSQGGLHHPDLNAGTYYVVSDRIFRLPYQLELCQITGVDEGNQTYQIQNPVYDNPSSIRFPSDATHVEFYDTMGRLIFKAEVDAGFISLHTNDLRGLYLCKIFSGHKIKGIKKIVFE